MLWFSFCLLWTDCNTCSASFQVFYVKYSFVNKLDFMLIKQHLWIIILWICCSYFSARHISRKNFCETWRFIPSASVGNGIWYTAWVMKNAFRFKHCVQILLSFRLNVMIKMSMFNVSMKCSFWIEGVRPPFNLNWGFRVKLTVSLVPERII